MHPRSRSIEETPTCRIPHRWRKWMRTRAARDSFRGDTFRRRQAARLANRERLYAQCVPQAFVTGSAGR